MRTLTIVAAFGILAVFLAVAFSPPSRKAAPPPVAPAPAAIQAVEPLAGGPTAETAPVLRPALSPDVIAPAGCAEPVSLSSAAKDNAASVTEREWAPWGRPERGWEIYAPLVGQEIGSACPPSSQAFAAALARWQGAHRLDANGVMTAPTFEAMRVTWLRRRPFVAAMARGCPPAPPETSLAAADKFEGYSGKAISLRPAALAAYRSMVAAARMEVPELAADHRLMTIFSGYRAPADDEARCDRDGGCGTLTRARCSAHRTGLAMDIYLGEAPGSRPESSEDANRLFQSRSLAYRWLVANGMRFGFVSYPFEPWHWEWAGESVEGTG